MNCSFIFFHLRFITFFPRFMIKKLSAAVWKNYLASCMNMGIKILLLTVVVLSCTLGQNTLTNAINKQVQPDIVFEHLTEKDGLSNENVTDILRDKDGFLWFSTSFGINRYDGRRFEVFRHNRMDSTTMLNNFVTAICEDLQGNIWGSTEDGIFCYEKARGTFRNYRSWDKSLYPRVNAIYCDRKGTIWAGSEFGLVRLKPESGQFEYFRFDETDPCSLTHNRVGKLGIAPDPSGYGLWVATNRGLNFFDFENEDFTNHRNVQDTTVFNNHKVNALHPGKNGVLWLFDENTKEIKGLNTRTHKITHRIDVKSSLKNPYAGYIFETATGHLWFSSNSYEIVRIDLNDNYRTDFIKNDITNPSSIIGDYVGCAWEDKDHTLWLGSTAGISRYNHDRMFYRVIRLAEKYPEMDNNWHITCMTQNPYNGEWWIGSREGKIYVYDPVTETSRVIDILKLAKGLGEPDFIVDIDFHEGLALICSIDQPTFQYDIKSNSVSRFYGLTGKYRDIKTRVMTPESDSTYILGNNYLPILRWNSKNNSIQEIRFHKSEDPDGLTYSAGWLNGTKDHGSWMSAQNSSAGYIHPGDSLIYTVDLNIGMKVGKGGYFNSLSVDKGGNVFFSYISQGLFQLKKRKSKVESADDVEMRFWDTSNGLHSENLQSSASDRDGNIWCASFNKFSVLNPETNSIFSFKINLSENNSFYYNYFIPLQNGHMLTNIKGNLVEFFPEKMKREFPTGIPLISSVKLPDKTIYISDQKDLVLRPEENFISIRFGCLSMTEYYPYTFRYRLEGVNNDWVESGMNSEAVYSNLPSGKYLFRLQIVSKDQNRQSEEKQLSIIILTPFYKSWWFITAIILIALGTLYYGIQARVQNLRNINILRSKAQLLEKEKTAVMYENLKQHLNPHFLFNSLTSLSSLIRIDPKQAGEFLDKMSKVYRYILRNKENETVPLGEELKFVEMYNQLQKTRFGNGLVVRTEIPEDYYHRKIAPVTLQNLVENAIKHNIADQESPLVIHMYIDDDCLVVQNNLQRKTFVETSNKQGQNSMMSLYKYLSQRPVIIEETTDFYTVKIPLI